MHFNLFPSFAPRSWRLPSVFHGDFGNFCQVRTYYKEPAILFCFFTCLHFVISFLSSFNFPTTATDVDVTGMRMQNSWPDILQFKPLSILIIRWSMYCFARSLWKSRSGLWGFKLLIYFTPILEISSLPGRRFSYFKSLSIRPSTFLLLRSVFF